MRPSLPQGTRDFPAAVVRKRQFILGCIRQVFETCGFEPLETPALENLETLTGKYGEEGDRLIFKVLNNGLDNPKKMEQTREGFEKVLAGKSSAALTERALRYDLTIPFARHVAMNHGQLQLPYRRYQMQPVWRADRPQKGRYREFWQCDADVVGSRSLLNEAELVNIYLEVFRRLGIRAEVRINNRKLLSALAEVCGGADKLTDITVAIDKLDKVGMKQVREDLKQRGLAPEQIETIGRYLGIGGGVDERLVAAAVMLGSLEEGRKGVEELRWLSDFLRRPDGSHPFTVDFTLARGLDYYTGTILEVRALGVQMGSIGGGGRYDDLTGLFGVPGIPGVGISFGVDRIYDVMEEAGLFPESLEKGTRVLFFNLGEAESRYAWGLMQELRSRDIPCELYHEASKFDRQFKYAERKGIPVVVIAGTREMEEGAVQVKHLDTGEQRRVPVSDLAGAV